MAAPADWKSDAGRIDQSRTDPITFSISMAFFITANCTGCTACIKRCPTAAISGGRRMLHVIDPDLCIDCAACGVVCPDHAIFDDRGNLCKLLKASQRPKAVVHERDCTGCEWCVWSCPFDALEMVPSPDQQSFARLASVIDKRCVGCKVCELDCPYDAIHIFRGDDPRWSGRKDDNSRFRARPAA